MHNSFHSPVYITHLLKVTANRNILWYILSSEHAQSFELNIVDQVVKLNIHIRP